MEKVQTDTGTSLLKVRSTSLPASSPLTAPDRTAHRVVCWLYSRREGAAPAAPVAAPVAEANDAELVAIITAAVAAYMAEEGTEYTGGFRVVSFKRVRGGRTWNAK